MKLKHIPSVTRSVKIFLGSGAPYCHPRGKARSQDPINNIFSINLEKVIVNE